jgi:hypothetical protein
LVVTVVLVPLGTCNTVTDALGTGAPLEVTVPLIDEVVSCATAGVATKVVAANGTRRAAQERSRTAFFTDNSPAKQRKFDETPAPLLAD